MAKRKLVVMTMTEIAAEAKRQNKILNKQVCIKGHYIILSKTGNPKTGYDIALSRVDSAEKILSWIVHLTGKNWITPSMIGRFVRLCCSKNDITMVWD